MVDFAKLRERQNEPRIPPKVPAVCIGVTGPRPHKLDSQGRDVDHPRFDGYDRMNPLRVRLREEIRRATQEILDRPAERRRPYRYTDADYLDNHLSRARWRVDYHTIDALGVTGGALGIDTDAAGVWLRMGLPYLVAVPFPGQESRWPKPSKDAYSDLLKFAAGVYYLHEVKPADDAQARQWLLDRNEWMCSVDDELIAVYDGSKGGTGAMVSSWGRFAQPPEHRIDPREYRVA